VGHSRVRRRVIVACVVLGALAATAVVVRRVWLNDNARAVDANEALERFREQSTTSSVAEVLPTDSSPVPTLVALPSVPRAGVYRYVTEGSEAIDVLGGATHEYPAETTITVMPDGCGVLLRWDVLQERREEWRLCAASDGVVLQPAGAAYHEFFAHGQLEDLACNQSVLLVPSDGEPRDAVALDCTLDTRPWHPTWQVLERGVRQVEGKSVPVVHVRMTVEDSSNYYEHTVVDWWLGDDGLPIAMSSLKASKSTSGLVGDVVYHERYSLALASLTPMQ
jgi:hypothetical protein